MKNKLTPEMLKKLFEKAKADGVSFPVKLTLQVGQEIIVGYMYEDGRFETDQNIEGASEMGSESKAGSSTQ